jgi:hypothetical protein
VRDLAPIALFAYNRPSHTQRTVEALLNNTLASESDLHVFCDGPKSTESVAPVEAVRRYLETVRGFRSISITTRERNAGLSASIVDGVTELVTRYGRVIVVEDDILTSPFFLAYMNDALTLYESESNVISIHGYVYPHRAMLPDTFFLRGADCWGWATWERGWTLFNPDAGALLQELRRTGLGRQFDFKYHPYTDMLRAQSRGSIDSWAIRWYASAFLLGKLTLYPRVSLVTNIGLDGSGTHSKWAVRSFSGPMASSAVHVERMPPLESGPARREFERFFLRTRIQSLIATGWNLIRHPRAANRRLARLPHSPQI